MAEEPVCIRRTKTVEEADIIVAWLAERGVEAQVFDRDNPGVLAFGLTDAEGIAIMVTDEQTAQRAKALLVEHDRLMEPPAVSSGSAETIDVTCEECGTVASFPRDIGQKVQECPECGAFVDIPEEKR